MPPSPSLSIDARSLRGAVLLVALLAAPGCGGDDDPRGGQERREDRVAALDAEAEVNEADGRERAVREPGERRAEDELAFASITISPESAHISTEEFVAKSTLAPGATAFTDVTYRWWVADREIPAYTRSKLGRTEGRWATGDTIRVQAVARDEKGREAVSEDALAVVDNTTPEITSDLRKIRNLDGFRLEAIDADGDAVTWSVAGDAPGVTISPNGTIRVRVAQRGEDFAGEAVFVASDAWGARSEIHIPLAINAAKEARTEESGKEVRYTDSRTLSDEDLVKNAEADADKFKDMTEAQINAELDARRKAVGGE